MSPSDEASALRPDLTNAELFARAQQAIPGGVNSPVRAFRAVGGTPYFVARGDGAQVWDVEGRRYLDLVQSYGAVILGHAHPAVVEAIQRAAVDGTSFGAPTLREVELAETISSHLPACEQVRLVSSGTEAGMTALRLARGFTGRDVVVKFAGNYHGHSDLLLAESGSGVATLGLPGSAGVPAAAVAHTRVLPYNVVPDETQLDETVACVVVEPVAANMGLIPPAPGFLEGLRRRCDEVGALLVFDEVITGFRVGLSGAQGAFGVTPDITCLGKVIGGGLPLAAIGGRREVMQALAPIGAVYQAGTLSGNPLATAAGLAVLAVVDDAFYAGLEARAERLAVGLEGALNDAGIGVRVPRVGPLVGLFFGDQMPSDYREAKATDEVAYARFFHAMLAEGVALAPGAYEALFPGGAHTDAVIDEIVAAAGVAAKTAASRADH